MEQSVENSTVLKKIYSKSCDVLENTMEILASWYIGQTILKYVDRSLWVIEKSAEWSLSSPTTQVDSNTDTNGTFTKPSPLVRPLPWLLFLPLLSTIRMIRISLNLASVLVGMDTVKSTHIVRFLQNRRRKIRALKFRGLKRINDQELEKNIEDTVNWKIKLFDKLKSVFCVSYSHNDTSERIIAEYEITDTAVPSWSSIDSKHEEVPKTEEQVFEGTKNKNLLEKLDLMANCPSDEDPDFTLGDIQSDEESASDVDEEIGEEEELTPIVAKPILKRPSSHSSITNEVIKEENEDSDTSDASSEYDIKIVEKVDTSTKSLKNDSGIFISNLKDYKNSPDVNVDSVTSDEYFSPLNSICASPEPLKDTTITNITKTVLSEPEKTTLKINNNNNNSADLKESTVKLSTQILIDAEKNQDISKF